MSLFRRLQEKQFNQTHTNTDSDQDYRNISDDYKRKLNEIDIENEIRRYLTEIQLANEKQKYKADIDLENETRNFLTNTDPEIEFRKNKLELEENELRKFRVANDSEPRKTRSEHDLENELRKYREATELKSEPRKNKSELELENELRNYRAVNEVESEPIKYKSDLDLENELRNYRVANDVESEPRKYKSEQDLENELRKYRLVSEREKELRDFRTTDNSNNELKKYKIADQDKELRKSLYEMKLAEQEIRPASQIEKMRIDLYEQQRRTSNLNPENRYEEKTFQKRLVDQDITRSFKDLKEKNQPKQLKSKTAEKTKGNMDEQLKNELHKKIITDYKTADINDIVEKLDEMVNEIVKDDSSYRGKIDQKKIVSEMVNDLTGFGPINPLLNDPDVTEVMVNGPKQVYAERKGKIQLTDINFRDNEHVLHVIEKIVAPIGRRIDESSPMVDARLPDGSRVNAIIPPLALNGPTITIRKFSEDPFKVSDLVRFGTLTEEMAIFLDACVKSSLNIFVSGGTGSGKTTTLNVLSSFIPNDERIITIEDAAELQLGQDHVISLETRPPNIEGVGAIAIRDLVRNSLRMRPDRIVIGEVRGAEALDMLQAMNTGHDGSLATGHSNSPRDMLSRLETMVLLGGVELPVRAIREQIAGAIDLIIQQSRLKDGTRKITNITEVQGLEGDVIVLQDIFVFKQEGVDNEGKIIGKLVPTGVRPKFFDRLESSGLYIPANVFIEEEDY